MSGPWEQMWKDPYRGGIDPRLRDEFERMRYERDKAISQMQQMQYMAPTQLSAAEVEKLKQYAKPKSDPKLILLLEEV